MMHGSMRHMAYAATLGYITRAINNAAPDETVERPMSRQERRQIERLRRKGRIMKGGAA